MVNSPIDKVMSAYQDRFLECGDTPKGVFWNDQQTQDLRFERLLANFLPFTKSGLSVLDVGCGTGALHAYLRNAKIEHKYTGIEVVPEMVASAKLKFPDIEIAQSHFLEWDCSGQFDICVLSGVFNLFEETADWKDLILAFIKKMYALCRIGSSFNFLTSHADYRSPELFYADPAEVFAICHRHCSRFITLDHSYPLYEFSITAFKESAIKDIYADAAFAKYFKR